MNRPIAPALASLLIAALSLTIAAAAPAQPMYSDPPEGTPERGVWDLLETMHEASQTADTSYFDLFTDDAVFFGTDQWERWTKPEFEALYRPYMESGRGWYFRVRNRHIDIQPAGDTALFDEFLFSESFGPCRGSGVARLADGEWKVVRYHLDITIPNGAIDEVVPTIRAFDARQVEIVFGEVADTDVPLISDLLIEEWPDIAIFIHEDLKSLEIETPFFVGYNRSGSFNAATGHSMRQASESWAFGDERVNYGSGTEGHRPTILTIERREPAGHDVQIAYDEDQLSVEDHALESPHAFYLGGWDAASAQGFVPASHKGQVYPEIVIPSDTVVEQAERIRMGSSELVRVVVVFAD
ncbi:MAG: nuclear transport factor 2 family protein [Planctomycetota bacterium]